MADRTVISHEPGQRLVVVGDFLVKVLRVDEGVDGQFQVVEGSGISDPIVLHAGPRDECARILDAMNPIAAVRQRSPYVSLAMIGLAVAVATGGITFSARDYMRRHLTVAERVASATLPMPRTAVEAAPASPLAQTKAPEVIKGDEPAGEEVDAQNSGNDQAPGALSPHGATGAGKYQKPAPIAAGHAPDASKMPPLPTLGTGVAHGANVVPTPVAKLADVAASAPAKSVEAVQTPPAPAAGNGQSVPAPGKAPKASDAARSDMPVAPAIKPNSDALALANAPATVPTPKAPVTAPAPERSMPVSPTAPAIAEKPAAEPQETVNSAPSAPVAAKPGDDAPKTVPEGLAERAKSTQADIAVAVKKALDDVAKNGPNATKDTVDKLKNIEDQLVNGDKISIETARELPPDVAKALMEAGLIETADEAAARLAHDGSKEGLALLRLPPDTIDKFRDDDGVPTVPNANSWVITRGNVILPLPGGGEIQKPSDIALFGLDM